MKINTQAEPINFGWNKTTHLEMTMLALKDSKIDNITRRQIARYSQMPDFDTLEHGFHNNTHFFYPYSKKKSFGLNSEKFNAFNQFKEHFLAAMQINNQEQILKHIGYAMHYLQDMTVPMHTEQGGFLSKILRYKVHKNFERGEKYGASANTSTLIQNYEYEKLETVSPIDLFKETAEFSQNPKFRVKNSNKKDWLKIQQACFNRGVNVTREFLERVIIGQKSLQS